MKIRDIATLIVAETLLSLVLFAGGIVILVFFLRRPLRRYKPVDMAVFEKLKPGVNAVNNRLMLFFTFLGKHQFLIPANLLLILYFLFVTHQSWLSVRVLTISLSSLVLMILLKQLFQRKRPLSPLLMAAKGLSFPSGHAIMSMTFYGLLVYFVHQSQIASWLSFIIIGLLVALILLIGFSRIYLRVHYASDVISGFIIGLLWLSISLAVLHTIEAYILPA
jgi:undecaprenyl-diphosphatase